MIIIIVTIIMLLCRLSPRPMRSTDDSIQRSSPPSPRMLDAMS